MRAPEFTSDRYRATVAGDEWTAHLAVILYEKLASKGVSGSELDELVLSVMDRMQKIYGGFTIYFRKNSALKVSVRDAEIYERYQSGAMTVHEIAQEYGHSTQWAYAVIRKIKAERKKQREAKLKASIKKAQREL